jgi:hypothetical protein
MIEALLGKIVGVLEKDFLFASFLPSLIFCSGVLWTLSAVIGFDTVALWVDAWTPSQKTLAVCVGTASMIVLAYLTYSMRSEALRFWSGESLPFQMLFFGLIPFCIQMQERQRDQLRDKASSPPFWIDTYSRFKSTGKETGEAVDGMAYIDTNERITLETKIRELRNIATVPRQPLRTENKQLVTETVDLLIEANKKYHKAELTTANQALERLLVDTAMLEQSRLLNDAYEYERLFGEGPLKPLRLGNIVSSYRQYPAQRYGVDAEVFWPRLQHVLKPEHLACLREPRMLLDFALAMASLSGGFSALALFVGPWLWYRPYWWIVLAGIGIYSCWFFYRLAIVAALQLGDMLRASCDLFRLDLIHALGFIRPLNSEEERATWEKLSRIGAVDYQIRPVKEN